jgi:type IV secretory pathway TraG/TraD family ATPase VirD4
MSKINLREKVHAAQIDDVLKESGLQIADALDFAKMNIGFVLLWLWIGGAWFLYDLAELYKLHYNSGSNALYFILVFGTINLVYSILLLNVGDIRIIISEHGAMQGKLPLSTIPLLALYGVIAISYGFYLPALVSFGMAGYSAFRYFQSYILHLGPAHSVYNKIMNGNRDDMYGTKLVEQISKVIIKGPKVAGRGSHISGAEVYEMTGLSHESVDESIIQIGGMAIDKDDEQQHLLFAGAPGTGKTVTFKRVLKTVRARKQRAAVYDPTGDYIASFYRPGIDILLDPLDARTATWNPWLDASVHEYAAIAASLIPDAGGNSDPFFVTAARGCLEALLQECSSMDEVFYYAVSGSASELQIIVQDAGLGGTVGPEKTFQSVHSTLGTYIRPLVSLPAVDKSDVTAFSFKSWLQDDSDSWVFISCPPDSRAAMKPVLSLYLDTLVRKAMSLTADKNRRIWLSLDELPSLQKLPALMPALAEGRKYGLTGVIGVQSFSQVEMSYGKEGAAVIWSLPKTRLYLRVSDKNTADQFSAEIGEMHVHRQSSSVSSSGSAAGQNLSGSSSTSTAHTIERAVLPSEIMALPDLKGYLVANGGAALVTIDREGLPSATQPAHVPGTQRTVKEVKASFEAVLKAAQERSSEPA